MKTDEKLAMNALEERLRREAPSFRVPEGFTERVMDRLERQETVHSRPESKVGIRWLIALTVASCAVMLLMKFTSPQPSLDGPQLAALERAISKIKLPEIPVGKVEALTAKLDEPLEAELKNVISDTRQAIQFVASNFLPEN